MYKQEYIDKMNKLLEDKSTYKVTKIDPTSKLQKTNNNIIIELFKTNQIDAKQKYKLYCSVANPLRLYGLPKIHKKDIALRPISSSVNVQFYKLSKHIGTFYKT